ncbi:MaoC/PaaZ C-terminal domain-containing protein [Paracoccus siganidrum]|nr:MaoC/PaaZ C-terminal domain-containing protein [Paracoccus siganidrum]
MADRQDETGWRFGPVSGPDMAEWCAFLRDDNAIHLRREAAEAAGFGPRRVNPGPANLAYVISAVMAAHPQAEFVEIAAFFAGNVFEDDRLAVALTPEPGATLHAEGRETPVLRVQFRFKEHE